MLPGSGVLGSPLCEDVPGSALDPGDAGDGEKPGTSALDSPLDPQAAMSSAASDMEMGVRR
jgi:hypothetical protein